MKELRKPVVGELVTMQRESTGKLAIGIVLPARNIFVNKGWCVFWLDLGRHGSDFLVHDHGWRRWDKYI
jgi:hypothetical protein